MYNSYAPLRIVSMNWLKQLFRAGSARRITVDNPLIIESPRIAFLNLSGSVAEALLNEDKDAFAPLFTASETSDSDIPNCDVLIIYCNLNDNGVVAGQSNSLRDIIDDARAPIIIVASENSTASYAVAGKRNGHATANLVMTLNRKGTAFTTFFADLFRRMFAGQSMPMAWVELAPQIPGAVHNNCPDTIFAAEISHVVFKDA